MGLAPRDIGIGVLFDLIRDAVVIADVETEQICMWNRAASEMFGYPPASGAGLPLEAIVPDALRDAHRNGISRYRQTGTGPLIDGGAIVAVPAVRRDGSEISVELRLTPMSAPDGSRLAMALIRDVTERAQLARQLADVNADLRLALQTERSTADRLTDLIAAKDDFLSILGHDLAGPLSAVHGHAALLRRSWDRLGAPERDFALSAIERAAKRMSALVRDLLDAARLDAGAVPYQPTLFDVVAALRAVIDEMEPAAAKRVVLDAPDPPYLVKLDEQRHSQVAYNLIGNALKFAPADTPVTVAVSGTNECVSVSVRDEGPGIAPEQVPLLFQRYHRAVSTDDAPGGTGLGLYIARRIVEDQGGTIEVTSELGTGSTFTYVVPRVDPPPTLGS